MDKKAMQALRKYFWRGVEVSREEYLKNLSEAKWEPDLVNLSKTTCYNVTVDKIDTTQTKKIRRTTMTKSEMLKNWKETSAIKSEFGKVLGERFPHLCYTDPKLLAKVQKTLKDLTAELSQVKDGEAEKPVKAKKEEAEPVKGEAETKVGETEVKTGTKAKAKTEKVAA